MKRLSIIAAVAANGVIGRNNGLPWHLAGDLKWFKTLTLGHHKLPALLATRVGPKFEA